MPRNLILLSIVMFMLVVIIGGEYTIPVSQSLSLAADIAPRLEISKTRLRIELKEAMTEMIAHRIIRRAAPLCFLAALLIVLLIKDWVVLLIKYRERIQVRSAR